MVPTARLFVRLRRWLAEVADRIYVVRDRWWGTGPQLDATDIALFEQLQWIAAQEAGGLLWDEPANGREYRVIGMPIYFVRRDEQGQPMRGYLVNFPAAPSGASAIAHPAVVGLGPVHRYDDQMSDLHQSQRFAFGLDVAGRPTFTMSYTTPELDPTPHTNTSLPYSRLDDWTRVFVHELFHQYQFYGPDAHWVRVDWGGPGVSWDDYPVTGDNMALSLLERRALLAGRDATTTDERLVVLRRILAIRRARLRLPEAVRERSPISQPAKTHGQQTTAPDGVGQAFAPGQNGEIRSLTLHVLAIDHPQATLQLQTGVDEWPGSYGQDVSLEAGENLVWLDAPFEVEAGRTYSFALFPTSGNLSLWSAAGGTPGAEAFFVIDSSRLAITPTPQLTFDLTVEGPNHIDRMDRYQERNEGSATFVTRRLFVRGGNAIYAQEMLEKLERGLATDSQNSRDEFMNTTFAGGWYSTGSTMMDLIDEVATYDWRSTFPPKGSPIAVLEALFGPASALDVDQLLAEAKQDYDWASIAAQVAAIPIEYLDLVA